jgi:hypothetical protein
MNEPIKTLLRSKRSPLDEAGKAIPDRLRAGKTGSPVAAVHANLAAFVAPGYPENANHV